MTEPSSASDGCESSASWTCGIELPVRLDRLHAVTLEQRRQRAVDEPDAFLELRLLMLLGRRQRALEVVEDRQELADQPLVCERDVLLALARGPLLVVLEVGGEPQQPVVLRLRLAAPAACSTCSISPC